MVNTETSNQRYHRLMSEQPPSGPPMPSGTGGFPPPRGQFPSAGTGPPSWPSTPPRGQSRALTYVALTVALIATGLALVGWFRPSQAAPSTQRPTSPTYTEQQIADARTHACTAFELVDKGVTLETNGQLSSDPAMELAQGTNARLTTISSGWYLKARLEPAAPSDLAGAIQHLSEVLLDLGANYLAGAKDDQPAQAALQNAGNAAFDRVRELCK
jgi:hypothetical protein